MIKKLYQGGSNMANFDPMTGEPIKQEEPKAKFDPMTGEPKKQEEPKVKFDPMTGEPIKQEEPKVKFDPMTGEPINQEESRAKFESMTTKPIPQTDYYNSGTKKKKIPTVAIAIGAVAFVVIIGVVSLLGGIFKSNSAKVLLAVANTFKEKSNMVEAVEQINILFEDTYTIDVSVDMEGQEIIAQYVTNNGDKQLSAKFSDCYDLGMPDIELMGGITSSKVKLQVPDLIDYVFTYDYKAKKKGYLAEELGEDMIASIDEACKMAYSPELKDKVFEDIMKDILKEMKQLKFEKVENQKYKLGDKTRNCKGYKVELTDDFYDAVIDIVEKKIDSEYGDKLNEFDVDEYVDEFITELREEADYAEDVDITFYLYKNKLACVAIEVEDETLEVVFTDCNKGMHDVEVLFDGEEVLTLDGTVKGSKETYELEMLYGTPMSLEYDTKSGEYSIDLAYYEIEGNLKKNSNGVDFSIDELGSEDLSLNVSITENGKMKKYEGKEFDIGNASEDDFEDVVDEISSFLWDFY